VLWEAQYGDFNNNAQVIIDEFIVSAREKWGQTPSLVLLLPHGHEGAGPDHSSARPERYLQMAAKLNIRLAYPTTSAQYFHLLRRQALLLETDPLPLVVMSPKSLLRNPMVASTVDDLTGGRWQPVIDDAEADPEQITRLLLCSGKLYYDLITFPDPSTVTDEDKNGKTYRETRPDVAIDRVEQLYPFPADALRKVIERYPNLKEIVWVQEEPKNMGGWDFMGWRLKKLIGGRLPVNYAGRRRSSSPAEGSKTAHNINQGMVVDAAFNHEFDVE
jgi:2-oxoglutarate dehydrogenase E1 component